MEESQEKIIVLRAYDTVVEANLAKTKLDAYGLPCFLTDENFTGMYPLRNSVFPGVRLHIFEDDGDEALRILGDIDRHEGFICCPNCGSHDHQHHLNSWERFSLFLSRNIRIDFPVSAQRRLSMHELQNRLQGRWLK